VEHATERSRLTFLPAVQAVIENGSRRFPPVTREGFVTVVLAQKRRETSC
jgi:hypothetical protein